MELKGRVLFRENKHVLVFPWEDDMPNMDVIAQNEQYVMVRDPGRFIGDYAYAYPALIVYRIADTNSNDTLTLVPAISVKIVGGK